MPRFARTFVAAFLALLIPVTTMVGQDSGADPITPERIEGWILDLDHDEFAVREAATKSLVKAGEVVVTPLATAAGRLVGEPRVRVLRVMTLLSRADQRSTIDAVEKAVTELTRSDDAALAREARRIIDDIASRRIETAVRLLADGGVFAYANGAGKYVRVTNQPHADSEFPSPKRFRVADELLAELERLPDLTFVSLRDSGIGDVGFAHIAKVPGLTHLDVNGTEVTDDGLAALERMPKLKYFSLKSPNVKGKGLKHLRTAEGLTSVQFCGKSANDKWLAAVEPLRRVGWLELNGTSVTGEGLAAVRDWSRLSEVFLNNNPQLDDAGLPYLADKSDLTWVELTHTAITQAGFDANLRDLPKVKRWGVPKGVTAPKPATGE